jgi:spore coat protein U-like protein
MILSMKTKSKGEPQMKTRFYLLAAASALALSVGALMSGPAQAVTDDLTVDAVIVEAITLDCGTTPLDFGNLDSAAASVVTVSSAGVRSATVPASLVAGGTPNAGVCALDGADGLVVDLNIPDDTITDGTDTLAISNFTVGGTAVAGGPNDFDVTLQVGGSENLTIGGDLTLLGGEGAGVYTGTITVTATYQ